MDTSSLTNRGSQSDVLAPVILTAANSATNNDSVPIDMKCGRMPVGSKIWVAAAKAVAAPSAYWIEFYLGCHAYPARPGI